jgi:hypothetical protein
VLAQQLLQSGSVKSYDNFSVHYGHGRRHVTESFKIRQGAFIGSNIAVNELDLVLRKKLFHFAAEYSTRLTVDNHFLAHRSFYFSYGALSCRVRRASLATRAASPKQHLPEGFFTSQAQFPAFTSAVIRSTTVDFPVSRISSKRSRRVKPKQ